MRFQRLSGTTKYLLLQALSIRNNSNKDWRKIKQDDGVCQVLHDALLASLQMQNVCVLAGSGTSLGPVNGPSMWELWKEAIGDPPSTDAVEISGKIKYELSDSLKYNIEDFLSKADAYLQLADDPLVSEFVQSCKKTILSMCSSFLAKSDLEGHIRFLHRLSRRRTRDPRLKLFTTNYDLCFEKAASQIGGVIIDGFSFSTPRSYDPRYFQYDIIRRGNAKEEQGAYLEGVIKLYKLHGSVNWRRNGMEVLEEANPEPQDACLIYPAKGKYQQSYIQPHLELISQYMVALREPNTCFVVTGFGFNDDHLSEPILSALKSNPHFRLIIADPSIKQKESDPKKSNHYWKMFEALRQDGLDIWLINADFQEFSKIIPDLRALSPAEKLLKAFKEASGG